MPGEQAALGPPGGNSDHPGLSRERQKADSAMEASSGDDWIRGRPKCRSAETPTGTAGEEKSKPSMLCKRREKITKKRQKTTVEKIQMDRPPDRSTSRGGESQESGGRSRGHGRRSFESSAPGRTNERSCREARRGKRNGRPRRGPKGGREGR